jgi:hypothetical protein
MATQSTFTTEGVGDPCPRKHIGGDFGGLSRSGTDLTRVGERRGHSLDHHRVRRGRPSEGGYARQQRALWIHPDNQPWNCGRVCLGWYGPKFTQIKIFVSPSVPESGG